MSFIRDVSETFGAKIIRIGVGLVTGIIIARYFGPKDRGLYSLILNFPLLIATLTNFGMSPSKCLFHEARYKQSPTRLFKFVIFVRNHRPCNLYFLDHFQGPYQFYLSKGGSYPDIFANDCDMPILTLRTPF